MKSSLKDILSDSRLYIFRGLPGSGKTTMAKHFCKKTSAVLVEMDMFRQPTDADDYLFYLDKEDNNKAAQWCCLEAYKWLRRGKTVVIANTFTQVKYIENIKSEIGVEPYMVFHCKGGWESEHNVPAQTMLSMAYLLERNPYPNEVILNRNDIIKYTSQTDEHTQPINN